MNITPPDIPYPLSFEKDFNVEETKIWMRNNKYLCVLYSVLYVLIIHLVQWYMSSRRALSLRLPMTLWSAGLALFSICGTIRILPCISHILTQHSFYDLVCNNQFYYSIGSGYWTYAFTMSKLYELGDTAFIVLRKQKLSFLHWYHHVTVFMYCWINYSVDSPSGLAFGGMNYVIHSLMYTYYTLRALRIPISKHTSMLLTSLQILQMLIGIAISLFIYKVKLDGNSCPEPYCNLYIAFAMYVSYLALFSHFFYERYMEGTKKKAHMNGHYTNGVSKKHE